MTCSSSARVALLSLVLVGALSGTSHAQQAILRYDALHHPVKGAHGMVVSQRATASRVGADVLAAGGNAVDAAVATAFALAVVLPRAGNLGGGGFMLVHQAGAADAETYDFREQAPLAATPAMFVDADGRVDQERYRYSLKATGVPGTVAGLAHAWRAHGSLPWRTLVEPAIALARDGFVVGYDFAQALRSRRERLNRDPYTTALFFKPDGSGYAPGERFRQPDLARTLEAIAAEGIDGFYSGWVAERLLAEMRRDGGLISQADLDGYRVIERPPVEGRFRGHRIVSMPPPSSGGVHLVQMLNVLDHFPLQDWGAGSARVLHVLAETMKRAYADRSAHLGDPDFHTVPVDWLTSRQYAAALAATISLDRATPAAEIRPGTPAPPESPDTTHLSVMDARGNAVALTYTLNFSFGNGRAVPGAGFLLNNEMTDFSAKAGEPDAFGLVTGLANAVAPGKRPLSAMTPTLVLRDGRAVLATGSPGGSRIINAVLQNVVQVLVFGDNVAEAVFAPRIHHQWLPDRLRYERGVNPDTLDRLRALGHPLEAGNAMGSVQSIAWDGALFLGAADPRRPDAGAVAAEAAR
ncbi:MAG: gamma-glutamyltransferase [Pseudomonadota bacterium]